MTITLRSLFAGFIAAVGLALALLLLISAVNRPLDGLSMLLVAALPVAAGWFAARRAMRRHG